MADFDTTVTLPAGEYYIGDPCYVLHEEWTEICDNFFFADKTNPYSCAQGEYTFVDGRRTFVGNTAYGDGTYSDNIGNTYGVDAGCLGIILLEDIDQTNPENYIRGGNIHTFDKPFIANVLNGVFTFGSIIINTRDDEEEEDEYDWDNVEDFDE